MEIETVLLAMSIPSAITGFCFWNLERKMEKRQKAAEKKELARQQNIETSIHAEYPKDCKIDPVDLCTILTNLLDNAMEACRKLPEASAKILSVTMLVPFASARVTAICGCISVGKPG